MRAAQDVWSEFDEWNAVIADVLFPPLTAPVPVYLDLEDEELEEIGRRFGLAPEATVKMLVDLVVGTSALQSSNAFEAHRNRLVRWRRGERREPPPVLPLLAVFSLAAERMATGEGMAAHNYYGRLRELLGGSTDHLGQSYRHVAEPMWGALNLWLQGNEGARGLPTATSIGFRYVGLAVSQALVREADRRRLERFFTDFDLAPRSEVPPGELEPLLDAWMLRVPCPATHHLEQLWRKSVLHARIAEVASTELAEWDGADDEEAQGGTRGRAVLSAEITSFPSRRLRLLPLFFLPHANSARTATLHSVDGGRPVELVPVQAGALTFDDPGMVDAGNLLEGDLRVTDPLGGTVARRPRRLVVFRRDTLSARWIEVRQVLMGDDVVILATTDVVAKTLTLLDQVARPGWVIKEDMPGLPNGWVLISGVEIFARPTEQVGGTSDWSGLVPLTSSQLALTGGITLPGVVRNRWHRDAAPELRAVSDSSAGFTLHLLDMAPTDEDGSELELESWDDRGTGSVIVDLAEVGLGPGDYAIEMREGKDIRARKAFALRTADQTDDGWDGIPEVIHEIAHPLVALGAEPHLDGVASRGRIQGAPIEVEVDEHVARVEPPAATRWTSQSEGTPPTPVALARPPSGSCFYTGAHRTVVETPRYDRRGRVLNTYYREECVECGLEKRAPANYYKNRRQHERRLKNVQQERRVDVRRLPKVQAEPSRGKQFDLVLDVLRFLGGGPISLVERVARQIDPSRLFLHDFLGTFEALGHIEVRRDPETLLPVSWSVCPTTIIDAGDVRVMTGFWCDELLEVVSEACSEHGFRLWREPAEDAPARCVTDAPTADLLEWLPIDGVVLVGRAGLNLADALPPLSEVVAALPRVPVPDVLEVQGFNPADASWHKVADMSAPGGYRLGTYQARYYLRSEEDVRDGTAAVSDVYAAKHGSALLLGAKPRLAYDRRSRELIVPLGSNLPGLYQRAAVMDSVRAPRRRKGSLIYPGVHDDVAGRLYYLMGS